MFFRLKLPARAGWPDGQLRQIMAPFARRVIRRYALETLHLALTWGLAAAAALLVFLHWTPLPAVRIAAAAGGLVAGVLGAWRWLLRPDALAIVRLADDLELGGGAVTAYRLLQTGPGTGGNWERAALASGLAACRVFREGKARRYPLVPSWAPWRGIAVLLVIFTGLALTPSPLRPYWEARREEKAALAAAAGAAERLVEPLAGLNRDGQPLLPEELRRRLDDLVRDVPEAGRREEAATILRQAGRDLDQVAAELAPAGQEAARLAALWQEQAGAAWQRLAAALAQGDAAATGQAATDLWSELARLEPGSPRAREAAWSFWQAAEATGRPELRQALREAARALSGPGSQDGREQEAGNNAGTTGRDNGTGAGDKASGRGNGPGNESGNSDDGETAAGRSLAAALADLAAAAGARSQLLAAAAGLEQLGAGLQDGYPAAMLAAGGAVTAGMNGGGAAGGSSNGPGTPGGGSPGGAGMAGGPAGPGGGSGGIAPGATGSPAGAGGSGQPGQGSGGPGAGSANIPAGGNNPGSGGQGAGGEGQGSGTGSGGNGSGQGKGGGAGSGGGGLEYIYAPNLIGGEGPASQVPGSTRPGAAGAEVNLPGAPVVRGAVRPYGEVYPTYTARARESLSRSPLPPALENLVWQYFSAIEPGSGQN